MKWSVKVSQVSGIGIYIHATFLLLLAWVAFAYWHQGHDAAAVIQGVGFILLLFLCVVLHELGHALTAKKYGIKTRDITLLPIGGVARLERMPDEPRQELWVALAGPAVNVVIAAVLLFWLSVTGTSSSLARVDFAGSSLVARLAVVNIMLVLFNLLPAFPMDGGRVLRALLAMRMPYGQATHIAARLGQGLAYVFGIIGLFYNPFLLFIAFFVWIGAASESSLTQMKVALDGIPVTQAMITEFHSLSPEDPLQKAADLILSGFQIDFPVTRDGHVVGVLTRSDLFAALARGTLGDPVGAIMQREFVAVDGHDMLSAAAAQLQTCRCHTLPVLRRGELVGLLTQDNLGEFIMIQSALGKSGRGIGARVAG